MASKKSGVSALAVAKAASSGLTEADMKRCKMRALPGDEVAQLHASFGKVGALLLPYFDAKGKETKFYRLRYLEALTGFAGAAKKPQRYAQAPDTLNEVYLPPLLKGRSWADVLADAEVTLYITEGEFKAACATVRGLPTVGLGGVDVWRSKKAKLPMLPQLEEVKWKGRKVVIVFDSDAATNPDVVRAQRQLAKALTERGAEPVIASLPPTADGKKQGLDDFLVAHSLEDFEAVVAEAAPLEGAEALWGMNEDVVFVRTPTMVLDRRTGERMTVQEFGHVYGNRWFTDYSGEKPKQVKTAKAWLEWPERFEVSRLTYVPGAPQLVDGQWNMWRGWGVEPKRGDVGPWHRLLDFIFKDAEPAHRQWFERWCAYPLQHPGTKLFTSCTVWGVVHGTGKSQIGYTLKDIYGENGVEIRNKQLGGSFNSWAENKQFVMGDEVTGSDKRVDADALKGLITQEQMLVNTKYIKEFTIRDCVNWYFTSNHPDAFFLEDTDRRFFIHEVVGKPAEQKLYDEYDAWRKRGGGPAALFDYLLRLPLGDFAPSGHAPMTRAKQDMIFTSKSDLGSWCREMLAEPTAFLRPLGEMVCQKVDLLTASQLLRCYDPEGGGKVTANGLGRELRRCGVAQLPVVRCTSGAQRLYVVRNAEQWAKAPAKKVAEHWDGLFGPGARKF